MVVRVSVARGLRIWGGVRRGLKLQAPGSIRPTSGRLREALLSIWGGRLPGCSFLDLFAGSGAVGLEAASRGAKRVLLVEGDRRVLAGLAAATRRALRPGLRRPAVRVRSLPGAARRHPAPAGNRGRDRPGARLGAGGAPCPGRPVRGPPPSLRRQRPVTVPADLTRQPPPLPRKKPSSSRLIDRSTFLVCTRGSSFSRTGAKLRTARMPAPTRAS